MKQLSTTQKLTTSAMVMAVYIVVLYFTQSFSFGAYQVRIATSLYALGYAYPFLVVPLGMANLLANLLFGGLGPLDWFGGCLAGLLTAGTAALIRKYRLSPWLVIVPITIFPGFLVPIWLSYLLNIPYLTLVASLVLGQLICGVCGGGLLQIWKRSVAKAVD